MTKLFALAALTLVVAGAAGAGIGRADGLPVLGVDVGLTGVSTPSSSVRFVALPAGIGKTVVARVQRNGGRVEVSNLLDGTYTIPAVAYDGSASGLAADGKTLVLIEPRSGFPRAETGLLVVDTSKLWLRPVTRISLRGDFSFDAISPHGGLMYLIQYIVPTDPNRYVVRAYDLRAGRLLAAPVRDARERERTMHGSPVTRALSPDGRWAYTLYDGVGGKPFVHALDTSTRHAHCVDLDVLAGRDLSRMRLSVDPATHTLVVRNDQTPTALVNLRTFAASEPQTPARTGAVADRRFPAWALIGIMVAIAGALALALGLLQSLRSRTPASTRADA